MNQPGFGTFCWNELATPNLQAAKTFYGDVLGWTFTEHEMGEMTYIKISMGGQEFGGMWQIPTAEKDHIPPHWMGYIYVEDIQQTVEKAEKAGASITMPITPAGNFGLFAVIEDPTGAHIAFWQALS